MKPRHMDKNTTKLDIALANLSMSSHHAVMSSCGEGLVKDRTQQRNTTAESKEGGALIGPMGGALGSTD